VFNLLVAIVTQENTSLNLLRHDEEDKFGIKPNRMKRHAEIDTFHSHHHAE
jgi:hypothetical protein